MSFEIIEYLNSIERKPEIIEKLKGHNKKVSLDQDFEILDNTSDDSSESTKIKKAMREFIENCSFLNAFIHISEIYQLLFYINSKYHNMNTIALYKLNDSMLPLKIDFESYNEITYFNEWMKRILTTKG